MQLIRSFRISILCVTFKLICVRRPSRNIWKKTAFRLNIIVSNTKVRVLLKTVWPLGGAVRSRKNIESLKFIPLIPVQNKKFQNKKDESLLSQELKLFRANCQRCKDLSLINIIQSLLNFVFQAISLLQRIKLINASSRKKWYRFCN